MNNLEKYINTFVETFEVSPEEAENLKYQEIEAWDSVGHMGLIAALEEAFEIEMETDDIIELNSFETGKEILKKYNIEL